MLNAQSTATELGRDPDMRRNVPMVPLLAPQPEEREKNLDRQRTAFQKEIHCIFHAGIYIYIYIARRRYRKGAPPFKSSKHRVGVPQ